MQKKKKISSTRDSVRAEQSRVTVVSLFLCAAVAAAATAMQNLITNCC